MQIITDYSCIRATFSINLKKNLEKNILKSKNATIFCSQDN